MRSRRAGRARQACQHASWSPPPLRTRLPRYTTNIVTNQTTPTPAAILDDAGRIAVDLPCLNCGYNLRTLAADGLCPECGTPVANSACGYYLRYAPAPWVRRLAYGGLLLTIAFAGLGFSEDVYSKLVQVLELGLGKRAATGLLSPSVWNMWRTVSVASLWLVVGGVILLTAPDPRTTSAPRLITARRVTRLWLWVVAAQTTAFTLSLLNYHEITHLPDWFFRLLIGYWILVDLPRHILALLLLWEVGNLVRRIPRPRLAGLSRLGFAVVLAIALLAVFLYVLNFSFIPALAASATAAGLPPDPNAAWGSEEMPIGAFGLSAPPPSTPAIKASIATSRAIGHVLSYAKVLTYGAGLALLILVRRALAKTARLAEEYARQDRLVRPGVAPNDPARD